MSGINVKLSDEVHREFKILCVRRGMKMKDLLEQMIQQAITQDRKKAQLQAAIAARAVTSWPAGEVEELLGKGAMAKVGSLGDWGPVRAQPKIDPILGGLVVERGAAADEESVAEPPNEEEESVAEEESGPIESVEVDGVMYSGEELEGLRAAGILDRDK